MEACALVEGGISTSKGIFCDVITHGLMDRTTLKSLVDAIQELSLARTLPDVMRIIRTAARELTGADGATFILKEGDKCFYAEEDAISPLWKGSRFPMSECISGWVMRNKESALIEDVFQDDRIPHDVYRPTFVKSLAMVPIRTLNPIGAIGNYWATRHVPTEREVSILQSLADITSVTIENINVYETLERRVTERTAELQAANQKLLTLNKELQAFSYSVSHDLRAPLRAILGYSLIIEEEDHSVLSESGKKALSIVRRNGMRMNQMIDDLLSFSRLSNRELSRAKVDSYHLVRDCAKTYEDALAPSATLTIDQLPEVVVDRGLFTMVWQHLLSNAIKYSAKVPQPRIEIGHSRKGDEDIFFVKDNGAGFDQQYVSKLFHVFQRLHSDAEFEGTGIGLALVKRIVERHGGNVWAKGKVNEGATISFSIPRSG